MFFHYQVPNFYLSSGFCSKLSVILCFPLLHFLSLPFCFKQRSLKSCFMDVMDLREKKSLGEDMLSENNKKFCTDCKTTKTPLWRGGPAGPKSLCNACGIRYRKKRRAMLGLNKGSEKKKERSQSSHSTTTTSSSSIATTDNVGEKKKVSGKFNGLSETVKLRFFALGSEVLLQRSSSSSTASFSPLPSGVVKKQRCQRRRKLGEEEQAAFSLMALSCGSVFA